LKSIKHTGLLCLRGYIERLETDRTHFFGWDRTCLKGRLMDMGSQKYDITKDIYFQEKHHPIQIILVLSRLPISEFSGYHCKTYIIIIKVTLGKCSLTIFLAFDFSTSIRR